MNRMGARWSSVLASSLLAAALLVSGCSSSKDVVEDEEDDEQVDIGYGTQSKDKTTSAVTTINADDDKRPIARVEELLDGTPGVRVIHTVDGGFKVEIRGVASIHNSSDPLYVIDDMPVQLDAGQGINWLNPRDIDKITVLKDASATAIYGSRGANGVVIIKTKRN